MGLDITAYRDIQRLRDTPDDGDYDYPSEFRVYVNGYFLARADGLTDGIYSTKEPVHRFRAGSYSGYNRWRRALSMMVNGVAPEVVWDNPDKYPTMVELIHFSDCEGVIGPKTSAKLAAEFAAHQDKADAVDDEYFRERYADWRKAFELASQNGVVDFH